MKQKKLVLVAGVIALLGITLFIGCFKKGENILAENSLNVVTNSNETYLAEIKIGDKIFNYSSKNEGAITKSDLKILKDGLIIYESQFELDTTINDYRLLQHKKVEKIAKSLSYKLDEKDYKVISANTKSFIETIFNSTSVRKKHVQSILFHFAIINTKMRAFENNFYQCVPHPGYILGRSYFWCQEDFYVDVKLIKNLYKTHPELIKDLKSEKLLNFINSTQSDLLSFDKIYSFYISKDNFLKSLDNIFSRNNPSSDNKTTSIAELSGDCSWWCPLGCGTDWGCCGNYSGCCLYSNTICYIHDAICTNCQPRWFCFSGCVPD